MLPSRNGNQLRFGNQAVITFQHLADHILPCFARKRQRHPLQVETIR